MSGLTRLALSSRAVVVLATLVVIGMGLFTATALRQELVPSLTLPQAVVISTFPGASPQIVEREVSEPLESALKGISGVTTVTSVSQASLSQVTVQWEYGEDRTELESKIRSAVDGQATTLPADVEPQVVFANFDEVPVIFLAVSSDLPAPELAARLKSIAVPKLSGIEGVRDASVSGEEVREVVITTRQADLDRFDVDASQIQQLFPLFKSAIPAGDITDAGVDQSVQVGKSLATLDDIRNIQLQATDGPVPLGNVADVVDQPVKVTTISRVNGAPSLDLAVSKTQDANTVAVSSGVRDALPEIAEQIGGNTKFTTVFDQAPWIEQSIHDLTVEGGLGLVMAVIVILLFLWSIRPTIITAISIPLSLLITLIALYLTDYTLNLLTLSALTVAVGRVVDDSIVVIENIERHLHLGETFSLETIVKAVKEVAGAVTASTLTTVAVFAPISLVGGQAGELLRPFGITVTIALLASLLVALTIVPVLASWFMRPSRKPVSERRLAKQAANHAKLAEAESARLERQHARDAAKLEKKEAKTRAWLVKHGSDEAVIEQQLAELRARYAPVDPGEQQRHEFHDSAETRLQRGYLPVLRLALRHPIVTLGLALVLFISSMGLASLLKTDFIGDAGQTSLQINQEMPPGSSLQTTDEAAKRVEAVLAEEPSVETFQATIGGDPAAAAYGGSGGSSNQATFTITLKADSKGTELAEVLRKKFAPMTDVGKVDVITSDGATGSQSIDVKLTSTDEAALASAGTQVQEMAEGLEGFDQVNSDQAEQRTILQVDIKEPQAANAGMNQATIGAAAAEAVQGSNLGSMNIDGVDRDVILRSRAVVATKAELEALQLPVTQRQTADAQKAEADRLTAKAERQQSDALAEQRKQLISSDAELRAGRDEARQQLSELTAQLRLLRTMPVPPPQPLPTQSDPAAEMAAQIAQLEEGIGQLNGTISGMNEQLNALDEQRQKLNESEVEASQSRAEQEAAQDVRGTAKLLNEVATVNAVPAQASITREDGARTVTISATPSGDDLRTATMDLQKGLDDLDLPDGVTASIGGVAAEQTEAFTQLFLAMGIAIALVYMIMVATFKSLLQPLILLVSIPFAATGAIGLLLITGTPLGLPAMIGLLMLIGVVVTNAIVLIDLVNTYRSHGASIDDAVLHGARLRLRPIIMTALATVMALFPMSLGLTGGGVFISKPLAVVVIGGLISSTVLTLLLVPVLYHLVEKARDGLSSWRRRRGEPVVDPDEDLDGLNDLLSAPPNPNDRVDPAPAI